MSDVEPSALLTDVHVMGIGGAGMSGIARILAAQGVAVSGCDARESRRLDALRVVGISCDVGHDPVHLDKAGVLIVSTAISAEHPEIQEARKRGIHVMSRHEALAHVMRNSRGLAIAGTHGKTTTTSMVTVALQHCGADPSFAIGSELNESGSNAHQGSGDLFVVEADESDGAFLHLPAVAAIVTNVEADHLNHWGTFAAIQEAFRTFASQIQARGGVLIACADDSGSAQLAKEARDVGATVLTYGVDALADFRISQEQAIDGRWEFDITGPSSAHISLQVPGRHNALNAAAAFALCCSLDFDARTVAAGLALFSGTRRRFELKGEVAGVRVFDDYAHHPTEIAATLRAARAVVGDGRLVVAFQAHHYYRTALFSKEFGEALGLADDVIVLEVYAPGETPIPGASGLTMAGHVPLAPEHVVFEPSWSAVAGHLAARARSGDLVMTLGAGDIGVLGSQVLELLAERDE